MNNFTLLRSVETPENVQLLTPFSYSENRGEHLKNILQQIHFFCHYFVCCVRSLPNPNFHLKVSQMKVSWINCSII